MKASPETNLPPLDAVELWLDEVALLPWPLGAGDRPLVGGAGVLGRAVCWGEVGFDDCVVVLAVVLELAESVDDLDTAGLPSEVLAVDRVVSVNIDSDTLMPSNLI